MVQKINMKTKYFNASGESSITHYEIHENGISIWFKHSENPYIYPIDLIGEAHFEALKIRAKVGFGLNSYIMRQLKGKHIR